MTTLESFFSQYGLSYVDNNGESLQIKSIQNAKGTKNSILIYGLIGGAILSVLIAILLSRVIGAGLLAACVSGIIKNESDKKSKFKVSEQELIVSKSTINSQIGGKSYSIPVSDFTGFENRLSKINDMYKTTLFAQADESQKPILQLFGSDDKELQKDIDLVKAVLMKFIAK